MKKPGKLKIQIVTKVSVAGIPRVVSVMLLLVRALGAIQRFRARFTKRRVVGYHITCAPAGCIVADGMMTTTQAGDFAALAVNKALAARTKIFDKQMLDICESNVAMRKHIKVLQKQIHVASKN